ncbi:MAG: hypothetical protein GKR89_23895 [Candidatus Latescibacteria bacterium]|nr:hypothetical protein [Candidatus Latescibacterota bacterium]
MGASTLAVGQVGLGLAAAAHHKGYASHPRATVRAVCDKDGDRARAFARAHGVGQVFVDFDEMLQRADIDAVDITTPTYLHTPMGAQAVAAGKHVLCEKPFCLDPDQGLAVCAAARRRGGAAHDPYRGDGVDIPIITWKHAGEEAHGVWMRAERLNGKFDYMRGFSTTVIGEEGLIQVLGEGGAGLDWAGQAAHLLLHRRGKAVEALRFDEGGDDVWASEISYYGQGHIRQVHHFVEAVLAGQAPRYGGVDGVAAVRCTLAAIGSAQTGRPVRLDQAGAP